MQKARSVQDLIDWLNIDFVGREIESKHNMIREAYQVPKYVADDYEDLKIILIHYYQYHFSAWMKVGFHMPEGMAWRRTWDIMHTTPHPDSRLTLIRGYMEKHGGFHQAVKNALTGRHGGLVSIIDQIAEAIKDEAVTQYVTAVFLDCIDPNDFSTRTALMREYKRIYGHVILPGDRLLSAEELAANIELVIDRHVQLINEFRKFMQ